MIDVTALGELIIDFAQTKIDEKGYPTLNANPGGAPANFLAPLAKFGLKTAMIGKVGNDTFGDLLLNTLKENKIDTKGVLKDENNFTTLAFVTFNEKGDRSFAFSRKPGADTQIIFDDIDLSLIDNTKIFHFGTLSLTNNPAKKTTKKIVSYAKKQNKIISFDPNLRKPLWNDLKDAKDAIIYGLKNADIVKISDEEVEFLFDIRSDKAIDFLLKEYKNIKLLYVTCGDKGAYFSNRKYSGFVSSLKDINVIDTTGAGDIFGGSAMYKLLEKKKDIGDLTYEDLNDIVKFASISAGLACTKYGGISSVCELEKIKNYL